MAGMSGAMLRTQIQFSKKLFDTHTKRLVLFESEQQSSQGHGANRWPRQIRRQDPCRPRQLEKSPRQPEKKSLAKEKEIVAMETHISKSSAGVMRRPKRKKSVVFKLQLALLILAMPAWAQPLAYDPSRRVPYLGGGGNARDEYHWWIQNTGQPSILYSNGIPVSQEIGTNDMNLLPAWELVTNGVPIGVVDVNNAHGNRVREVAELTSGAPVHLFGSIRSNPDDIANGVSNYVAGGYRVIVVPHGGNSVAVSNALRFAEASNVVVACSVPNVGWDLDVNPDYPSSWAHQITSIVPVTATDRTGVLYGPNAAAWGTNVVGAAGRNIVAYGTYSSGCSYAAPIVGGALSLLVARFPHQTSVAYRQALWESSAPVPPIKRLNARALLDLPRPLVRIASGQLTVQGLSEWKYDVEGSWNMQDWGHVATVYGGETVVVGEGFYRAKVHNPAEMPLFSEMAKPEPSPYVPGEPGGSTSPPWPKFP